MKEHRPDGIRWSEYVLIIRDYQASKPFKL